MRIYILNALVPPEEKRGLILVESATLEELREIIKAGNYESFVGHESTAKLLGIPTNRGEAKPQSGDIAYVVRLKRRLERPDDIKNVTEKDVEVLKVTYLPEKVLYELRIQGVMS